MSSWPQVEAIARRSLVRTARQPAMVIPPLVFPVALMAVNAAGLQSSTELYPVDAREAVADLARLLGPDAVAARAPEHLDAGEPVLALLLAEAVEDRAVALDAHRALLDAEPDNFWLSGWLRDRIAGLEG